ncbi:hypothetical protein PJL18_01129 [Paenarthrobacter nicotinovorans]|nr:hypothetical protein [Paenarthrobacter nicotinovorans]
MDGNGSSCVLAGLDIDADEALAALRPVAGDVRQVDRTRRGAPEGESAAVGHRSQLSGPGSLNVGNAQSAAVGIDVVLQRRNDQVLPHNGCHVVGVDHGCQRARGLYVDDDTARGGGPAIPHGDGDVLLARCCAGILVGEQAIAANLHLVLVVVRLGIEQDEVVTVGIHPIGEDVLADGLSLLHEHGGGLAPLEEGRLVLFGSHHMEGDLATGRQTPSVCGVVVEDFRSRFGIRGNFDLESGAPVDVFQRPHLGAVGTHRSGEDVAVGV